MDTDTGGTVIAPCSFTHASFKRQSQTRAQDNQKYMPFNHFLKLQKSVCLWRILTTMDSSDKHYPFFTSENMRRLICIALQGHKGNSFIPDRVNRLKKNVGHCTLTKPLCSSWNLKFDISMKLQETAILLVTHPDRFLKVNK